MTTKERPASDLDAARVALDVIDRAGDAIVQSLDSGDVVAAGVALDDRQRAVVALAAALERSAGAETGSQGRTSEETELLRDIRSEVRRLMDRTPTLEQAVDRARVRAHEGLRAVRCGHRLVQHGRTRGAARPGGWCDVER